MRSCRSDSRAGCCVSLFCPGVSAARGSPSFWQAVPSGWQLCSPACRNFLLGFSRGQAPRLAAPPYLPLPRPQQQQLATVARPGTRWRGQRAGGRKSRGTALSSPAVSAHPKAGWTMNTVKRNWRKKQPDVFRQTVAGDASRAPRSCRPSPALREPRRLAFWLF